MAKSLRVEITFSMPSKVFIQHRQELCTPICHALSLPDLVLNSDAPRQLFKHKGAAGGALKVLKVRDLRRLQLP